jgi:hypothetical protein
MRPIGVFVHVTLDGFFAGTNGGLYHFAIGRSDIDQVCSLGQK